MQIAMLCQVPQAKIEVGLHLTTHFLETGNKGALGGAAAWQRSGSAWEDLQQQRRQLLAGREAWKLDWRKDDQAVKLLPEEKEKKICKPQRSEKSREGAGKGDRGRFRDSQPSWERLGITRSEFMARQVKNSFVFIWERQRLPW